MGYFNHLQIKTTIPTQPFPELLDIASRAHELLKNRTAEEINSAASSIDNWIEQFFEIVRDHEIEKMREQRLQEFFIYDGEEGEQGEMLNGSWLFNNQMEDNLDCPKLDNTSALNALTEYVDYMWDPTLDEEAFHRTKEYEIYAVLAMMLVQESSWILKEEYSLRSIEAAGRCSIAAMEAICYAAQRCSVNELSEEAKVTAEKIKVDNEDEAKKKLSNHSKEMNKRKYAKLYEANALVETEWLKNPNQFISAPRAGKYYCNWLNKIGYTYVESTVTNWIRVCAKKNGIKFR